MIDTHRGVVEGVTEEIAEPERLEGIIAQMAGEDPANVSEMVSDIASRMRMRTATVLNSIDDHIAGHEATIAHAKEHCDGPLKMRASRKGVTYLATVCTSSVVTSTTGQSSYELDDEEYLTVTRRLKPHTSSVERTEDYNE